MLTRRSLMLAGLTVPAAVIGARAALALTQQQEVLDKARISFDKLITSVEFGELPGYMKRAKGVLISPSSTRAASSSVPKAAMASCRARRRRLEPAGLL